MFGYVVRRLVAAFLVVVVTSMLVFALFFYGPSDPANAICQRQGGRCTPDRVALLSHSLGFDQSAVSQYGKWAKGVVAGREISIGSAHYKCSAPCFGISYSTRQDVTQMIKSRFPATLSIAIVGAAIYLFVGLAIGIISARYRGSLLDRMLMSVSLVINAFPYPLLAILVYLYGIVIWGIFPESGYNSISNPAKWAGGLVLAWLAIGLTNATSYARFSRGSMLETLGEDYVRTAMAKGLPARKVLLKHTLRAAIVPVVTIFGLDFATLLAGTVYTEQIFSIQGIGYQALHAIQASDLPLISATVLIASSLIVLANLIVDILYSVLDPRVRLA